MKTTIYKCDWCGKERDYQHTHELKLQGYIGCAFGWIVHPVDICTDCSTKCMDAIRKAVNSTRADIEKEQSDES